MEMLLLFALAPASHVRLTSLPSRGVQRPVFPRTGTILLEGQPTLYEQYLETRQAGAYPAKSYEMEPRRPGAATAPAPVPVPVATATDEQMAQMFAPPTLTTAPAPAVAPAPAMYSPPPPLFTPASEVAPPPLFMPVDAAVLGPGGATAAVRYSQSVVARSWSRAGEGADAASDTGSYYEGVPWWRQDTRRQDAGDSETQQKLGWVGLGETQRKDRRTVFMHNDWVRHRSSDRFARNMKSITSSGINSALRKELTFVTLGAMSVVVLNMLFYSYQDLSGVLHPGPLMFDTGAIKFSLPALPFTILMPALSLLLVFRTNTGYSRWNEARTLWGGVINNCRNVVRQSNTFFPDDEQHHVLKRRMAAETAAFVKSLRNFLRGPSDDATLRDELYELVEAQLISPEQADATMAASNRPMFCLSAMSATLRKADVDPQYSARIDASISVLVDLTGANERIFKSPIPLVYTRLTARFLTIFLVMLPLALWGPLGDTWNHWATIPAEFLISFFLFGIEEVGIQIEEPFSILPLEAFCNGAIAATTEEMLGAVQSGVFEDDIVLPGPSY